MKRLPLIFLMILLGVTMSAHRRIAYLDLRRLLTADYSDSLELLSVWDELHTVSSLQGVVNKSRAQLYINYITDDSRQIDSYWWQKYRQQGQWLPGRDTVACHSVEEAVQLFAKSVKGLVVYDSNVASTSNVASAVAGIESLVAVRYDPRPSSLYSRLTNGHLHLPVKVWLVHPDGTSLFTGHGTLPDCKRLSSGSVKNDPYLWFIEKYMKTGRCNGEYAGYYIDQKWRTMPERANRNHHQLTNHDFFVSRGGFFFDLSPWQDEAATDEPTQKLGTDYATLQELLSEAYRLNGGKRFCYIGGFPSWAFKYAKHAGGQHEDVATEWTFSTLIGAYNAFEDADAIGYGALANASFWQHFPLKNHYPQHWITRNDLKRRGLMDGAGKVVTENRNYLVFYVGDYDASSWVYQRTSDIWENPQRGQLPLMWCVSPVLQERVPMVLDNFRRTATANDYFAAADNGAGYLMPGMLQYPRAISHLPDGLDAWAHHCRKYYHKWGLSISGFIIDGDAPALSAKGLDCYASFSPNGIVPQKSPLTLLHGNMPILRSDYDVNDEDVHQTAETIVQRVRLRGIPFHWFRSILKKPEWYVQVMAEVKRLDPTIQLLDAPAFFELYRQWLKQNPNAAKGLLKMREEP